MQWTCRVYKSMQALHHVSGCPLNHMVESGGSFMECRFSKVLWAAIHDKVMHHSSNTSNSSADDSMIMSLSTQDKTCDGMHSQIVISLTLHNRFQAERMQMSQA